MAGKIRVHELAQELGISSAALLHWLKTAGEFVKSASSTLEAPAVLKARQAHAAPASTTTTARLNVALLARELRVRPNDVLKTAERIGIHLTRVGALLSNPQADAIRAQYMRQSLHDVRRTLLPPPAAGVPTGVPAPPVGPPHACDCCGLHLPGQPVAQEAARCNRCADHYEISGEDDARALARLQDHDRRLRHAYAVTWTREHEAEERMRAAYHSRDTWRGALVELMGEHEESARGCTCGAKAFPCPTWKYLERRNRGILRQVEDFLAMKDDERDRKLYRRDHWDVG
jgi:transposase-like protein